MISFIIPAHNEEFLICGTISALHTAATATSERYEIIVVDDASTDGTATVAVRWGAQVHSVQYRHIAAARNAGAAEARESLSKLSLLGVVQMLDGTASRFSQSSLRSC